jgi:hypothetical protein
VMLRARVKKMPIEALVMIAWTSVSAWRAS